MPRSGFLIAPTREQLWEMRSKLREEGSHCLLCRRDPPSPIQFWVVTWSVTSGRAYLSAYCQACTEGGKLRNPDIQGQNNWPKQRGSFVCGVFTYKPDAQEVQNIVTVALVMDA